jgi:hypothetical protein
MSPQRANFILSSDIPHSEANVLVLHSLDVETNGGDGGHDLSQFQFVKDSGLLDEKGIISQEWTVTGRK